MNRFSAASCIIWSIRSSTNAPTAVGLRQVHGHCPAQIVLCMPISTLGMGRILSDLHIELQALLYPQGIAEKWPHLYAGYGPVWQSALLQIVTFTALSIQSRDTCHLWPDRLLTFRNIFRDSVGEQVTQFTTGRITILASAHRSACEGREDVEENL